MQYEKDYMHYFGFNLHVLLPYFTKEDVLFSLERKKIER